jgi:hypothetical protein
VSVVAEWNFPYPKPPAKEYPWRRHFTYVNEEVAALKKTPPLEDAPASVWIEWHDRFADAWYRLGLCDPTFAEHDKWLGDDHRQKAKELRADPNSVTARQGYWAP